MSRCVLGAILLVCGVALGSGASAAPPPPRAAASFAADLPLPSWSPRQASAATDRLERLRAEAWASETATYADLLAEDAATLPTAVYDIMAHVVVMPGGDRLEAHSGLGERADDPRFVAERMRGATPPALYDLEPRRPPFHGVAALRLKPVAGDVFGRTGLLAHTYMLHGRPESNGCVVFRDYAAFLKAFREGRIRRLRVVPSVGDAGVRIDLIRAAPPAA